MGKLAGVAFTLILAGVAPAQEAFSITGTQLPADLSKLNYGSLPAGIVAFDLSICNTETAKQPVTSTAIYQAMAKANPGLQPIGRQIMLAAILRNQRRSVYSILNAVLTSASAALSVVGAAQTSLPPKALAGAAVGSMAAQQLLMGLKPVLTADQIEKFESQVLEPALVLDSGSCVERTVFAVGGNPAAKVSLSFHVR